MKNSTSAVLSIVLLIFVLSCKKDSVKRKRIIVEQSDLPVNEILPLSKIATTNEDNYFVDSDGELFFPCKFNYTNLDKIVLIEDNLKISNAGRHRYFFLEKYLPAMRNSKVVLAFNLSTNQ